MNITYTYEIISADEGSKTAEVRYTSDGLPTHVVSVRFPFSYETVDDVIKQHSPVYQWSLLVSTVTPLIVGTSGSFDFNDESEPEPMVEEPVTPVETPAT